MQIMIFLSKYHYEVKNSQELLDKKSHKNQTDHDKTPQNSLKLPHYMAIKCQEGLGVTLDTSLAARIKQSLCNIFFGAPFIISFF